MACAVPATPEGVEMSTLSLYRMLAASGERSIRFTTRGMIPVSEESQEELFLSVE